MILYRGYLAEPDSLQTKTRSDIDLKSLSADMDFKVHESEFSDKLLWVSSDREYAQSMATSRYIASLLLHGNESKLPVVVSFDAGSKVTGLYIVEGDVIRKANKGESGKQMIAQSFEGALKTYLMPFPSSFSALNTYLITPGYAVDSVPRITSALWGRISDELKSVIKAGVENNLKNMNIREGLDLVINKLTDSGINMSETEQTDLIAKGIFGGTISESGFLTYHTVNEMHPFFSPELETPRSFKERFI